MAYLQLLLLFAALTPLVLCGGPSSSGGGAGSHSYDRSGQSLTDLYNSKVVKAESVWRPFPGKTKAVGPFYHSGVRVTLEDNSQWLIHKGKHYGRTHQTVVTDARHMSSAWKTRSTRDFNSKRRVSDFVRAGGGRYNIATDNCHGARRRMMRQKTS